MSSPALNENKKAFVLSFIIDSLIGFVIVFIIWQNALYTYFSYSPTNTLTLVLALVWVLLAVASYNKKIDALIFIPVIIIMILGLIFAFNDVINYFNSFLDFIMCSSPSPELLTTGEFRYAVIATIITVVAAPFALIILKIRRPFLIFISAFIISLFSSFSFFLKLNALELAIFFACSLWLFLSFKNRVQKNIPVKSLLISQIKLMIIPLCVVLVFSFFGSLSYQNEGVQKFLDDRKENAFFKNTFFNTSLLGLRVSQTGEKIFQIQTMQPLLLKTDVFEIYNKNRWSKSKNKNLKNLPFMYEFNPKYSDLFYKNNLTIVSPIKNTEKQPLPIYADLKFIEEYLYLTKTNNGEVELSEFEDAFNFGYYPSSNVVLLYNDTNIKNVTFDTIKNTKNLEPYLTLPKNTSPKIKKLATKMAFGEDSSKSPFVAACKIAISLKKDYTYLLNSPYSMTTDFTENFLFKSKKGNCTAFASSMVVLCRSLNIPCRYVIGYSVPNTYIEEMWITDLNQHAWCEVYFPDFGWVEFDPTASNGNQNIEQYSKLLDVVEKERKEDSPVSNKTTSTTSSKPNKNNPSVTSKASSSVTSSAIKSKSNKQSKSISTNTDSYLFVCIILFVLILLCLSTLWYYKYNKFHKTLRAFEKEQLSEKDLLKEILHKIKLLGINKFGSQTLFEFLKDLNIYFKNDKFSLDFSDEQLIEIAKACDKAVYSKEKISREQYFLMLDFYKSISALVVKKYKFISYLL